MTQSTDNIEPHDGIDPYDNKETRASETQQSDSLGRAGGHDGATTIGGPPTDVAGTGSGNPLDGVEIDDEDAAAAVSGDTGPEHPGTRRSS